MKRLSFATLVFLLTILLAVSFRPTTARADDDWEDRWEEYYEEQEELREEYEERMEDRREALEEYWEDQRERQRKFDRRGHAWYGNYGPYYGARIAPNYRGYGPRDYFSPALPPGYYGYAPELRYHSGGCGPFGPSCHHDLHHDLHQGSVSIGPVRVFWE